MPCSAPNLQEEFSSCRSYPITKGFTSIRRQSYPITPHEMWLKPFWWYPNFVLSPVFKYKALALVGVLSSLPRSNFPGSLGARKHYRLVLDCKTVGSFFSKSVKKSVKRGVRVVRARREKNRQSVFLASLPSLALCFQPRSRPFVWPLARTWIRKIRTVLQSNLFCFDKVFYFFVFFHGVYKRCNKLETSGDWTQKYH